MPATFSGTSPFLGAAAAPWRHRSLVDVLARRDLAGRYRGSLLGHGWAVATPLAMLAVYTLVFGVILPSRWPGTQEQGGLLEFALRILSGLLVHGLLAEAVTRAPALVTAQPNYVTKVVFPLEVLGWVNTLTATFHAAIGVALLIAVNALWGSGLAWSNLAVPVVLAGFVLMVTGLVWIAAALGVYVRDLTQAVGPLVTVLMFLGPVFYPREAIPSPLREWLVLNPVTVPIEQVRRAVFQGEWPLWDVLAGYLLAATAVYLLGAAVFASLKRGFADVL